MFTQQHVATHLYELLCFLADVFYIIVECHIDINVLVCILLT